MITGGFLTRAVGLSYAYIFPKGSIFQRCMSKNSFKGKNIKTEDIALRLMFGSRKYEEFTRKEKRLVDAFQSKIVGEEAGPILPNTRMWQEQQEIYKYYMSRRQSKPAF
jgi:hypothetical protein